MHGDPGPLVVMHACDNRSCINPDHLSVGTARDNVRDMIAKGRAVHKERMEVRYSFKVERRDFSDLAALLKT